MLPKTVADRKKKPSQITDCKSEACCANITRKRTPKSVFRLNSQSYTPNVPKSVRRRVFLIFRGHFSLDYRLCVYWSCLGQSEPNLGGPRDERRPLLQRRRRAVVMAVHRWPPVTFAMVTIATSSRSPQQQEGCPRPKSRALHLECWGERFLAFHARSAASSAGPTSADRASFFYRRFFLQCHNNL